MKRKIILLLMTALGVVTSVGQINDAGTQGFLTRGKFMYDNGNYVGCIDQMSYARTLLLTTEQAEEVDYYIAQSSLACGYDDAKSLLQQFLGNYPSSSRRNDVIMSIGDYEFTRDNYGVALSEYMKVSPESLNDNKREDYYYRMAYCRLKLAEYDTAMAQFARLGSSSRYGNASRFYQGYIAYCKREYDKALRLLESVNTQSAPADKADYYLSQIYFIKGDYEKSQAMAQRLLKDGRDADTSFVAEVNRIAGESLYNLGEEGEAMPYLKKYVALSENPLPSALYIIGISDYRAGKYSQAIKLLTLATSSENAMGQSAYLFIGQSYMHEGNVDAALLAFEKASNMEFDSSVQETAFYNYAVARLDGGRVPFGSSVAVFEKFLQKFPSSKYAPTVQEYVISGYMTDNNYENALISINNIKSPNDKILAAKQRVLFMLGTRNVVAGNIPQAIKYLKEAKTLVRYDSNIARECDLWLGDCYYRQNKFPQSSDAYLAYLKKASSTDDNRLLAYYNLGYSRFGEKRYGDAMTNFARVVKTPGNLGKSIIADAYNRIGDCYYYDGKFGQAADNYNKAHDTDPATGDYAIYQKALMKGHNRHYGEKIDLLEDLLKNYPKSGLIPSSLLEMAETYVVVDDNTHAIETYKKLVTKYPSTMQGRNGLLQLAITYMNIGNKSDAVKSYKEVIKTYPTSEEARVASDDLKRIYADDGRLNEYARFINSVSGAPRMEVSEMDSLSFQASEKAYLNNKDVTMLKNYVSQYPKGGYIPQAVYYLCIAASGSGDDDEALDYAVKIVKEYPDAGVVEDALAIKADIEYRQGKGDIALNSYKELEKRASTSRNLNISRLGIMRVSRDLGNHADVVDAADKLISSFPAENEDMSEIKFTRAYSLFKLDRIAEAEKEWGELAKDAEDLHGAKSAYYLAQYYFDDNKLAKSRKVVEALIDADTPHRYWLARAFILLSDINRKEGKIFEADEYLKNIRDNYPGNDADIFQMIDERLK